VTTPRIRKIFPGRDDKHSHVGSDILETVVVKTGIFFDVTPNRSVKAN
jgi:hypothetical protein